MTTELKNASTIKSLLQISLRNVEDEKQRNSNSLRKNVLSLNMANEILGTLDKVIAKTNKGYIPKKKIPSQITTVYSLPYPKQKQMRGKAYSRKVILRTLESKEETGAAQEEKRKTFRFPGLKRNKVSPFKNDYLLDDTIANQKTKLEFIIYKLSNLFK
ncbi:hypothetical protein HDV01_007360 [Terramyces sp. JEL0728]|nr:hypothetical protein HDV01_007360 [Terramyces sp. JEL0728]